MGVGIAVALSQSRINSLLERCCMGVVNQIKDLDNSSEGVSGHTCQLTDELHQLTDRREILFHYAYC